MIQANELRVGNYVIHSHSLGVKIPAQIDSFADLAYSSQFDPIPLTPEWLVKFSFKADRSGWHLPSSQFSLTDKFYPCWLDRMLWPQDINDFKETKLEYVHQLQNLIFALTGTDLSLQL